VFGDLTVSFKPQGGAGQVIGKAGGLAVYTPNPLRRTTLNLRMPPGLALAHGTLSVTYQERPEDGGRLMAAGALDMP
jgi:hypothetical protein